MTVRSMTGFARGEGSGSFADSSGRDRHWTWMWELRSVNSKGLDVRCRLPSVVDSHESALKKRMSEKLARGSVTANLVVEQDSEGRGLKVNMALVENLFELQSELEERGLVFPSPPKLEALLGVRGVIETDDADLAEDQSEKLAGEVLKSFDIAVDQLIDAREEEGAHLLAVLSGHIDEIADLTERAAALALAAPEQLKLKIKEQLDLLLAQSPPVSEDRLAQELAILATKADVREELDRLSAHVASVRDLLGTGGAIGRRLDFICQELNREANTICSKSSDLELTNIGLELKTIIERFREQVQNVE